MDEAAEVEDKGGGEGRDQGNERWGTHWGVQTTKEKANANSI